MTNNESKEPAEEGSRGRKPRGMGGVILILALLTALFLVVSKAGIESQSTVHAFYSYLLNGRVESLSLSNGVATAEVRTDKDEKRRIEVVVREFLGNSQEDEVQLYSTLAAQKLDVTTYPADQPGSTARFLRDLEQKKFRGLRAFFIEETEPKAQRERKADGEGARKAGSYLTVLMQRDAGLDYVRLDPPVDGKPSLLDLTFALRDAGVPVRSEKLSLGDEFRITEPNTALIYVLSTVGPWLLVLLIVWFFILRQMRSPGGTGGVLSFGRSRAALYTKENRTNVTFDDVAGMEEAKAEVREIIEFLKNPAKFARLGGSIPRGVLLVGSP
ncbi:MAG: hypothetical protein KDE27_05315, partial [Planctomycetes bacterium]|nr:hypothetical protein [Planctomycetota bacterium]